MDGAAREDFVPGDFRVPRDWNTDQYLDRRLGTACFTNRHTYLIDISSFCWVFLLSASCFLRRQKICWLLDWTCKWACTYSRARNGFGMMLKLELWGEYSACPVIHGRWQAEDVLFDTSLGRRHMVFPSSLPPPLRRSRLKNLICFTQVITPHCRVTTNC